MTYGPQKGASSQQLLLLEKGLARLAEVATRDLGVAGMEDLPGSGAAGGCGVGIRWFLDGDLVRGATHVLRVLEFEHRASKVDLVITGEGAIDGQTLNGKLVSEVLSITSKCTVPCWIVAGSRNSGWQSLEPLAARISCLTDITSIENAINRPAEYLREVTSQLFNKS